MSLVRAFTTRRANRSKSDVDRAASVRDHASRPTISGPINLISSTNTLAYDAPDIAGTKPIAFDHPMPPSFGSNTPSFVEESDASSVGYNSAGTFTDASSVDESPISPEPNHLSCYFKPSVYEESVHSSQNSVKSASRQVSSEVPMVPQRAPSHSKQAHVQMSRKKSISRLSSPVVEDFNIRESADFFRAEPASLHPFGKELEQLNEVAEEFASTARDVEADADRMFMRAHGLGCFSANDYLSEIDDMLDTVFEEEHTPSEQAGWF